MTIRFDAINERKVDAIVQVVEEVAFHILHLPGDKVISIATSDGQGVFTFSDEEPNRNQEHNFVSLLELILDGIMENGVIVIRQFTGETGRLQIRGIPTIAPIVNTFAIRLTKGQWYGLSSKQVKLICSANLRTGEPISEPPLVKYLDFVS